VDIAGYLSVDDAVFFEEVAVDFDTSWADSEFPGQFVEVFLLGGV